jgi:hypothetical protein
VRGDLDRLPGGVPDVAVGKPSAKAVVECAPEKRPGAVGVLAERGQQERRRFWEVLA